MMNGVNRLKIRNVIGRIEKKKDNDEEEEEEEETGEEEKEKVDIDISQPSTSGTGLCEEPKWNNSTRQIYEDNLKSDCCNSKPIKCATSENRTRERIPSLSDSASSDDSCVYMYKGDGSNKSINDPNKNVNCSSPEMDYLEMDFDPCQSNGHESSDGSYSCEVGDLRDEDTNTSMLAPSEPDRNVTPTNENSHGPSPNENIETSVDLITESHIMEVSKITLEEPVVINEHNPEPCCSTNVNANNGKGPIQESDDHLEENIINEAEMSSILHFHLAHGPSNLSCCLSTINQTLCLMFGLGAKLKNQHKLQELLLYREIPFPADMEVPDFLRQMSHGMLTVPQIQEAIDKIFGGTVVSKFFSPYPSTVVNVSSWLQSWTKKGAIALLCWNFHLTGEECNMIVNPSWHFQLVNKCSSTGIQIHAQEELIHENVLKKLLNNPSEVLIQKDVVLAHWNPRSSLIPLLCISDQAWKQYNVLGQVVNMIRDTVTGKPGDDIGFVRVPSPHKSGILLLMRGDNIHLNELSRFEKFLQT